MRLRGCHYRTRQPTDVILADGVIASVGPPTGTPDREAGWIAPALFDLQINGCLGKAFVTPTLTVEDVATVVHTCRRHGISGLCPTLVTGSFDTVHHGLSILRKACEQSRELSHAMPGFHLEVPYISP